MAVLPARVLFGAAYYYEYQPYERLKTDLDLMADARFTVIRVGESVWSTWEPENGRFDLDWLQPVLDGAHERGIAVILGTPTYAVPPWLARRYPEIAGERAHRAADRLGRPAGGRLHPPGASGSTPSGSSGRSSPGTPATRRSSGSRWTTSPATSCCTTTASSSGSSTTCGTSYGDVETLNREWGLVYWSHRLSTWADLWTPDGNAQPQYDLAWRRVPGRPDHRVHRLAGRHRPGVRARRDQFVTTCISYGRPAVHDDELTERLDVDRRQPVLRHAGRPGAAGPRPRRRRAALEDHRGVGAVPDRRPDVLVAPGAVPGHRDQRPVHRHAVGQPAGVRRPVAAGRLGARRPRRADDRVLALAHAALRRRDLLGRRPAAQRPAGPHVPRAGPPRRGTGRRRRRSSPASTPDADITMVYSMPSKWLMQKYPPLAAAGRRHRTPRAYHGIFDPFYRGAFDAGLQVRIVHAGQLHDPSGERAGPTPESAARRHPVLVVAGAVRRRRRDARLARRLRGRGRPPACSARAPATPTTRPARDTRSQPGTARRGRRRLVRRVQQPGARRPGPCRPGRRRSTCRSGAAATRWADGLTVDGRRCARRVRPPALRPLAGGHHPPPRRGPGHLRRHGTRTRPRPGPRRMARAGADRRMAPTSRPPSRPPPPPPRTGAASTSSTTGAGNPSRSRRRCR